MVINHLLTGMILQVYPFQKKTPGPQVVGPQIQPSPPEKKNMAIAGKIT